MGSNFNITGNSAACAKSVFGISISFAYAVGSVLFPIYKAKQGVLEPICIREVKLLKSLGVIYMDTYNALWGENELCIEADARQFAIEYLDDLADKQLEVLEDCSLT